MNAKFKDDNFSTTQIRNGNIILKLLLRKMTITNSLCLKANFKYDSFAVGSYCVGEY